jgi:hypothetical protein
MGAATIFGGYFFDVKILTFFSHPVTLPFGRA